MEMRTNANKNGGRKEKEMEKSKVIFNINFATDLSVFDEMFMCCNTLILLLCLWLLIRHYSLFLYIKPTRRVFSFPFFGLFSMQQSVFSSICLFSLGSFLSYVFCHLLLSDGSRYATAWKYLHVICIQNHVCC